MTVLIALNKRYDRGIGNVIIDSTILNLSFIKQIEGHEKNEHLKKIMRNSTTKDSTVYSLFLFRSPSI